ncbi:hypothetical protein [Marinifilum sp. D737]|uniref:hypothetical protein n=1 Tax=Marinifilum sp. D737 TaxID=2969628 RepID=UPI00227658C0|nr:hypothetical protein [Marinifilum sp. D737]MCY1635869.1 hypothetical protein [Marinifilum sp. D737]
MKRILLSLIVCLGFMSFANQTFAQSSAVKPYAGATHTYTFNNVEANAAYEFYVTESSTYSATPVKLSDFGVFIGNASSSIGATEGAASIQITWDADAYTNYGVNGVYLFLNVTADGSSCGVGNYKAVHIMPQANDFNVAVAAAALPTCADLTNLQPVVNTDVSNLTDYTHYEAGTTSMTFTITRESSTNQWSGAYTVSCDNATVPFTIDATPAATGDKTGSISGETGDSVTVTVIMKNTPGTNPTFTLTMTSASDDVTGLDDLTLGSDTHMINLMPKIGDFVGE